MVIQNLTLREDTKTYTNKDVLKEVYEVAQLFNSVGYPEALKNIYSVKLTKKYKNTYGTCEEMSNGVFLITINEHYLKVAKADDVHNTIAHEVCHSLKDCMNHGPKWKAAADKLNRNYKFTPISRCGNSKEYKEQYLKYQYKHKLTCNECGKSWRWIRKAPIINSCLKGTGYCSCGSHSFTYTYIGGDK